MADAAGTGARAQGAGKAPPVVPVSLGLFKTGNPVRIAASRAMASIWFDRVVLLLILVNSVVLAMVDFGCVDGEGAPVIRRSGALGCYSWRNHLFVVSDPFFIGAFTMECVIKCIAMGFVRGEGTYLRDAWNKLDFCVVIAGLLEYIVGVRVGALRAARVMRPLQALHELPRLQSLVVSLLHAVPALGNVVLMMGFIFFVWGILALQLWGASGAMHGRCRLTEQPVRLPQALVGRYSAQLHDEGLAELYRNNPAAHACLPNVTNSDGAGWGRHGPRPCAWPIDHSDGRLCGLAEAPAGRVCGTITSGDGVQLLGKHRCGSNYVVDVAKAGFPGIFSPDVVHPRFDTSEAMRSDWTEASLSWGLTSFDNLPSTFLSIFQCITLEGWSEIMYQVQDAYSMPISSLFFFFLTLIGAFFMINFTLAVLYQSFLDAQLAWQHQHSYDDAVHAFDHTHSADDVLEALTGHVQKVHGKSKSDAKDKAKDLLQRARRFSVQLVEGGVGALRRVSMFSVGFRNRAVIAVQLWWRTSRSCNFTSPAIARIVQHKAFDRGVILLITLNSATLSLDRTMQPDFECIVLEKMNFVFAVLFTCEMVLKILGCSLRGYVQEGFNLFDALIVCSSILELALSPPPFFTGATVAPGTACQGGSGAISALRTFRLLRVMRLMQQFEALHRLLDVIVQMFLQVLPFGGLLLLFIVIFSLLGMQLFANRFRFDPCTLAHVSVAETAAFAGAKAGYVPCTDLLLPNCSAGILMDGVYASSRCFETPRTNFDTLLGAFGAVFQTLSGEDWNVIMYDAYRSIGLGGMIYFLACVVGGYFVILNLFLAVLLGCFEAIGNFDHHRPDPKEESPAGASDRPELNRRLSGRQENQRRLSQLLETMKAAARDTANAKRAAKASAKVVPQRAGDSAAPADKTNWGKLRTGMQTAVMIGREELRAGVTHRGTIPGKTAVKVLENELEVHEFEKTRALWLFTTAHPARRSALHLVRRPWFEKTVMVVIIISSLMLALENPLEDPDSIIVAMLKVLDPVITGFFAFESGLKIIAFGFVLHRSAYLRTAWNQMDFAIVVISLVSVAMGDGGGGQAFQALRVIRTLRALRPLRMIERNPGMKQVVNALLHSIPAVANVVAISLLFLLIFAIVGVNYFKGEFAACQGSTYIALSPLEREHIFEPTVAPPAWAHGSFGPYPAGSTNGAAPTSRDVCLWLNATWAPSIRSDFDNVGHGMLTLFEMSTTEGWTDVMWAMVDSTGLDMQPRTNHNRGAMVFGIAIIIFFSLFIVNMFVGVIIDTFSSRQHSGETGGVSTLLTFEQRQWIEMQKMMLRIHPATSWAKPDANKMGRVRRFCFEWTYGDGRKEVLFARSINVAIVVNTLFMAMRHFGQPVALSSVLDVSELLFALIFTMEAVVKLVAVRRHYFVDHWNRFDLFVVIASNAGLMTRYAAGVEGIGGVATVARVFRLSRIIRLMRQAKNLRSLIITLLMTLPHLVNISSLLILLYFIYAVLGMQLFSKVEFGENLNSQANFRTFGQSMLTMVRCSTGEFWNGLMHDLSTTSEHCEANPLFSKTTCGFNTFDGCTPLRGCGSPVAAFLFFVSFVVLVAFVFLNLFICVIIDGWFDQESEARHAKTLQDDTSAAPRNQGATERPFGLTTEEYKSYCKAWIEVDRELDWLVTEEQLFLILGTLPEPVGLGMCQPGHWPPPFFSVAKFTDRIVREYGDIDKCYDDPEQIYQFDAVAEAVSHRVMRIASPELYAKLVTAKQSDTGSSHFRKLDSKVGSKWNQRVQKHRSKFKKNMSKRVHNIVDAAIAAEHKLINAAIETEHAAARQITALRKVVTEHRVTSTTTSGIMAVMHAAEHIGGHGHASGEHNVARSLGSLRHITLKTISSNPKELPPLVGAAALPAEAKADAAEGGAGCSPVMTMTEL